jgi:small subunit ribosomal protein S9
MVTKDSKTTTKKAPAKVKKADLKAAAPKAKAVKPSKPAKDASPEVLETAEKPVKLVKASIPSGKYTFATGRRKTAVANVRLFSGQKESVVNKKPFKTYFSFSNFQEVALRPLHLTGLGEDFHFSAAISGGGMTAQAQALQHGLAQALVLTNAELRLVLKKNGMLTRDDRKKERKKPGLKRARRAPQWAKR